MKNLLPILLALGLMTSFLSCSKEEISDIQIDEQKISNANTFPSYARGDDCPIGIDLGTADLTAGQNTKIGTIHFGLSPDGTSLMIEFEGMDPNWIVGTTHIYVGDLANVPAGNGGPKNGHFPYGTGGDILISDLINQYLNGTYSPNMVYTIPLSDFLTIDPTSSDPICFVVMVHAEVYQIAIDPTNSGNPVSVVGSETAWASGMPFNSGKKGKKGGNWSMYNEICL